MKQQLEIERKFIVSQLPEGLLEKAVGEKIKQGYLILENQRELRIRQRNNLCWMTLKQGSGLERFEQECQIPDEQFKMLWPLTEGKRIEKIRYLVENCGHVFEIDIFSGSLASLLVLEVEFSSVEASRKFRVPDFVKKEVTDDKNYKNAALATDGLPKSFSPKCFSARSSSGK